MSYPHITDLINAALGTDWAAPLPTFGALVALAIVTASRMTRTQTRWQESLGRLPPATHEIVDELAVISVLAGIVGARLFHIADQPAHYLANPAAMIFSRSGFSIYGGLCFGCIAGIWFLKRRRIPIAPMLDAAAPAMLLGYGLGRLGCQLAGDGDWGIQADMGLKPGWVPDWLWAQTYDGNILGVTVPAPGVYPTPLYECAAALSLCALLLMLRSPRHRAGHLFSLYLLFAGFERLLIEKIRVNVEHQALGYALTQAEIVSVALIVTGIGGVVLTLGTRLWARALFSLGALAALSACAPF